MSCKLKIISGPEANQEFTLSGGESFLGKSPRCAVRLSSPSVSYEHAVITREGNDYFIENLSAHGTWLNGDRISTKARLRVRDQVRFAPDVAARIETLPAQSSGNAPRKVLIFLVLFMLVAGVILVAIDPLGEDAGTDWNRAAVQLQSYTQSASNDRDLPRETGTLFREAWRLELARDRAAAAPAWARLHVLLSSDEPRFQVESTASRNPKALGRVLNPKVSASSDEELKAALLQFVMQMERRK